MQKLYNLFYILNSFNSNEREEILIDFKSLNEMEDILNELPEFEPSDVVIERVLRFV